MKRVLMCLLTLTIVSGTFVPVMSASNVYKEFYVSPSGNDKNAGTALKPFKTIQAAKSAVDTLNNSMTGDIVVNISEGTYYLDEMLDFGTNDSGYNGYRVIYQGTGSKKPVLSGGKQVTNFTKTEFEGIYSANVDTDAILQLSVNGKRRYPAKSAALVKGVLDSTGTTYDYDDPATEQVYDGFYVLKRDFKEYENLNDVIFAWNRGFVASYLPVKSVMQDSASDERLIVSVKSDSWEHYLNTVRFPSDPNWPNAIYPKPEREFMIMNAFELLDEPGEFYYNKKEKKLYYMPHADENMENAVVIVPELETLISIDGNDISDKVKNIAFRNLQFSDTKWDYSLGFSQSQSYGIESNGNGPTLPRTVLAERADGIEFSNNIFSNTGGTALDFYNGVSNSTIKGNVFYDIGGVAINSGAPNHGDFSLGSYRSSASENEDLTDGEIDSDGVSDPVPTEYKDYPVELAGMHTTKITSSNYLRHEKLIYPGYAGPDDRDYSNSGSMMHKYVVIHKTWADKTRYRDSDSATVDYWRDGAESGNVPYVMFEFLKPYTINKISIAMMGDIAASERSDFEILVSNDKNFEDYKRVTYVESTSTGVNNYSFSDTSKYKYVMIRKLTSEPFAMGRVWIESNDRKPYVKNERCKNLVISNNLIERAGVSSNHSLGISITHGEGHKILHNEIHHLGYTGMSIGYSWSKNRPTCYDLEVAYNYIYDSCRLTYDGGGIYMLGPQKGSVYHNNYIERTNQAIQGLYTDNGSRYQTLKDNYVEGASVFILSPYVSPNIASDGSIYASNGGISEVTFDNTYALHQSSNDAGKELNIWEEPIQEILGQPSKGAYDTYENAGLESGYEYLREFVAENYMNYYDRYNHNKAVINDEWTPWKRQNKAISNILKELEFLRNNGNFGTGLGMYPLEYRYKLDKIIGYVSAKSNADIAKIYTVAREFEEEIKSTLKRYSIDETVILCEGLINEAEENILTAGNALKEGTYPENAVIVAKTALNEILSNPQNTSEEKYEVLTALEGLYNNLADEKIDAEIKNVYVPGAERIEIKPETRKVTVYMPKGKSLVVNNMSIEVNKKAFLWAIVGGEQDLGRGIAVPVRNKVNGKFKVWEIKAEYSPFTRKTTLGKKDWVVNTSESDRVKYASDGVILSASNYGYIATAHAENSKTTVKFKPLTKNEQNNFSVLLGVNSHEGFDYANTRDEFNCIELEFNNSMAEIYTMLNGEKLLIGSLDASGILWNSKNTLSYQMSDTNGDTKLSVMLNGNEVYNGIVEGTFGRYMGFYNPYINVKVY